ncbi:MAG: DNA recombination protein RmuC [Rickettsiaceae bacterium]|nr:DNA recombination protein RmuC [Rickettsiaceae bacterium]
MIYFMRIVSLILVVSFIYVMYKNISLKAKLNFLEESDFSNKLLIENLEKIKIEYIKKIEQLSSQLTHQGQFISEFDKLRDESKQSTKAALFDLGNELSKQLIEIHKKENKESRDAVEQNISKTSVKFNAEFERIVNMVGALSKEISQSKDTVDVIKNALLSPSGAGSLAEITLENILISSGLRINLDFIMQYNVMQDDSVLRPDSIIFLPNDKLMVVDAKASKFLVEDRGDFKNLAKTMNTHLRSLSSKNYAESVKKNLFDKKRNIGNIITLMFVPSEHAIEKIIEADGEFMNKAWKANIFPVGPAGLMNMLSFARFQISEQMMMHNHQLIIEEVKKLLSSVGTMADHSARLGSSLSGAVNHYDKFAASFNRNFLSKARNISKMGIEGGMKKSQESLQRFHLVTSQSDPMEIESDKDSEGDKNLEKA